MITLDAHKCVLDACFVEGILEKLDATFCMILRKVNVFAPKYTHIYNVASLYRSEKPFCFGDFLAKCGWSVLS